MLRISVILPNRNHGSELPALFQSFDAQQRPPDEVVIVDDASTDNSRAVIADYAAERPQVKILFNESNLGVPGAIQKALAHATGDYIFMVSADEVIEPDALKELAGAAVRYQDCALVVSRYREWDAQSDRLITPGPESDHSMWYLQGGEPCFFTPDELEGLLRRRFVWLGMNTALIRRDALDDVGGLDPALRWHSDWFAMYAIALRYGFCAIPSGVTRFRLTPQSYSRQGMADRTAQENVAMAIQSKLDQPSYADVRQRLLRAPTAMSTFFRPTVFALAKRPLYYPRLLGLLTWWGTAVICGRRRPFAGRHAKPGLANSR